MRIGIDVQATIGYRSGLGIYTTQLISHLRQMDHENEYILLGEGKRLGEKTHQRFTWENLFLPLEASKKCINLLHTPAFSAPFMKGRWRTVVTIHDLIGMVFPNHLSLASRWYWGSWLPFVNGRSERIIVDSESTKRDVIKHLKADPKKIRVVYLSAADRFTNHKTQHEIELVSRKFGIEHPYLLFVGNIEPRKNLLQTIRAFSNVRKANKLEHRLVIAGSRAWNYPAVNQLIQELGLSKTVHCLNYVDDEELVTLYNGAQLFVFPSLYEGFGLPILEAMKCGVPVLTSNLSSIPEVAGDAVYYVNPHRQEEIEEGIATILTNVGLQEKLRQKGFSQASKFSWKTTARKTLDVYQELLG